MRAFYGSHAARWPEVSFRAVRPTDSAILSEIYASARAAEMAQLGWPAERTRRFLDEQCQLQDEHYRRHYIGADFLLVLLEGRPVGRVYVHRSRADIRLMEITVRPAQRGQGLGRALLAELIDESQRTGVSISLHVEPDNPARAWYERLGFRKVEDRGVNWFMVREVR
jgi:ribosomal protein S18 acetylase RimI-like enzyme